MEARTAPGIYPPPSTDLATRLERLREFGPRDAYRWRDGARWRRRSYDGLRSRILGCAARLAATGVTPGTPVLIQGPASADWVEALLATFLLDAVAVPLDEATPESFRFEVARISGAQLLVAPRNISAPPGCPRLQMGDWGGTPVWSPPVQASWDPERRAEMVFTSGTTGDPKGVVLTHGNLASDFGLIERAFLKRESLIRPLGELRFLSTLPLSHMFGQALNVFLPLFMGLTVIFVPARPRDILEVAHRAGAWGIFTVPRLMDLLSAEIRRVLREAGRLESFEKRQQRLAGWPFYLQSLFFGHVRRLFGWRFRLFVVGGAALPEEVQRFWEQSGYLVVQGYGLTETAPIVSISNPFVRRAGSVGKPLGIQEVKLGADGEVLVRGPNVTRGYLGSEGVGPAEGWLHTGDLGEIDARGRLRIRGRLKDVIVTAEGENVYPADVEAALAKIAGVREACVFGLPASGGERVHAVLILEPGADAEECVRQANENLQAKQRVKDYTVWEEEDFPRTPTGKVRKGALRDRILSTRAAQTAAGGATAPTRTGARRLIARVAKVDAARLSAGTRLVEGLGFASLDLVELAVAFEEEFGVTLPEERLNEATVGDLERAAAEAAQRPALSAAPPLEASSRADRPSPVSGSAPPEAVEPAPISLPGSLRMPRWTRFAPVRWLRRLIEEILMRPFVFLFTWPRVIGRKHLREAQPPFLFVANHHSYMDTGLFKVALRWRVRGRIAPAMTTRYHRVYFGESGGSRLRYLKESIQVRLVEFFFNAWPLPETAGFKNSLNYAGELADAGYSLLIFPEGRHVPEGEIETFRGGIGIFARDLRMPVIPAYVEGTADVLPDHRYWPKFGKTKLVLGAPMRIDPDADPAETTRRLEEAIRILMKVTRVA